MGIREMLAEANDTWQDTEVQETQNDQPLPEGRYAFEVRVPENGVVVREDDFNNVKALVVLEVVESGDGTNIGRTIPKSWRIIDGKTGNPDEAGLRFLKTELERLGLATDFDMSQIAGVVQSMEGSVVEGNVKHKQREGDKDPYVNVYLNSTRIASDAEEDTEGR